MLSSSCFRIPCPELSAAAAVLETTINTAVYAQQYVRYTKNETIAAAAAAAAAPLLPLPLRSSAAGPCRARYATAGLQEDPNTLVVVKKHGGDWGACGRPRRRDLATSLALRDGRGEGGPARGQGPRDRGLSLGASLATK